MSPQRERIEEILAFWFDEIDDAKRFRADPVFDRELERRFGPLLDFAKRGDLDGWCDGARGRLALILLLDQFSRNIHRDDARAFEADPRAQELCLEGIQQGADSELTPAQRSFFYLPLRHAEDVEMQRLGLEKTRELNRAGYGSDEYALGHLEQIERFGRFPHRNAILGRENTPDEDAFLAPSEGGS